MSLAGLDIIPLHQIARNLKPYKKDSRAQQLKKGLPDEQELDVMVKISGRVYTFPNLSCAENDLGFTASHQCRAEFKSRGWFRTTRGILVWKKEQRS